MAIDPDTLKGIAMDRFSWDYEDNTLAEQWFMMARAFQEASCHLFAAMIEKQLSDTYHHAKVAASQLEHAVELFLKAGIAQAGKDVPNHHRLDGLAGQFRNLYPGKKYQFEAAIDQMLMPSTRTPHNKFSRYPTDEAGKPWLGNTHIDLVIWYSQAVKFLHDFDRIEPQLKVRYPAKI